MTSRSLRLALLIAVLLPLAALAETDPVVAQDGFQRHDKAVDWLLDHDDPRYRAAGLIYRVDREPSGDDGVSNAWNYCIGRAMQPLMENNNDQAARDSVKLITTHGELAGARRFAERYGIDCA